MASIDELQVEIAEEFELFESWMDKYEHIISLGKELPIIEAEHKTESNLIKGCQSQVWLHASLNTDNKVEFRADSDAIITKGLIALMVRVFDGQSPADIAKAHVTVLDNIGLHQHLSPTRSNGLASMVKQMKLYGLAFAAKGPQ